MGRSLGEGKGYPLQYSGLVNFLPCAVFLRIDLTLAILCSAALTVKKALGAIYDRTDSAGQVQIALCAGTTSFLCKSHSVMADIVQRIAGCNNRKILHLRNDLDTQTAGANGYVVRSFRDDAFEFLCSQKLIAQKVNFFDACNVLALFFGECCKIISIGFFYILK